MEICHSVSSRIYVSKILKYNPPALAINSFRKDSQNKELVWYGISYSGGNVGVKFILHHANHSSFGIYDGSLFLVKITFGQTEKNGAQPNTFRKVNTLGAQ